MAYHNFLEINFKLYQLSIFVFILGTLSTCLLYCGRHSDTKIYANPEDPTQRFLLVNLTNFPYMSLPVGSVPTNVDGSLHSR